MGRRQHHDLEDVQMRRYLHHKQPPHPVFASSRYWKALHLSMAAALSPRDAEDQACYCLDAIDFFPAGCCTSGQRLEVTGRLKTFITFPLQPIIQRS